MGKQTHQMKMMNARCAAMLRGCRAKSYDTAAPRRGSAQAVADEEIAEGLAAYHASKQEKRREGH